jgi:two-component system, cell cycle response regulator DivK
MAQALVVDDNEINRILACRLLSKAGWTVADVEDGEKALDWLTEHDADLALVDIAMPNMSGEDVCRIVREKNLGGADLKVVAYTAHAMPEELEKFMAGGFDAVLCKPISRTTLLETLSSLGLGGGE